MRSTSTERRGAWVGTGRAAELLGVPEITLRRLIERHAKREDTGIVSRVDGVTARKLGRLWRVCLDPTWLDPANK